MLSAIRSEQCIRRPQSGYGFPSGFLKAELPGLPRCPVSACAALCYLTALAGHLFCLLWLSPKLLCIKSQRSRGSGGLVACIGVRGGFVLYHCKLVPLLYCIYNALCLQLLSIRSYALELPQTCFLCFEFDGHASTVMFTARATAADELRDTRLQSKRSVAVCLASLLSRPKCLPSIS